MKHVSSARKERREIIRAVSHKRLRTNLKILAIVYVILIITTIVHLCSTPLEWWQTILSLAIGLIVGLVSSRMLHISWDHEQEKVIGKMDIYGVVILILFIAFELFRSQLAGLFVSGDAISSASFLILTFAIYGRLVGMSSKIIIVAKREFSRTK